jgi:hypothetical protein
MSIRPGSQQKLLQITTPFLNEIEELDFKSETLYSIYSEPVQIVFVRTERNERPIQSFGNSKGQIIPSKKFMDFKDIYQPRNERGFI